MPFLPYSKVHALVAILCDVIMATQQSCINNPNPLLAKAYLTNLNLNHFKMIEAMGLKLLHLGLV
jgi:hypothetical protein